MGAMMKQGENTRKWAVLLLEDGMDAKDVAKKVKANPNTVRVWKSRYVTNGKESVTAETVALRHTETATAETETATETPTPVSENRQRVTPVLFQFVESALLSFHPADAVYYAGVGLVCYAMSNTLPVVGVVFASIWVSLAATALQGVKTARGGWLLLHVLLLAVLEVGGAAVHIAWANAALWANVKALPFDIWENKYLNDLGEVVILHGGSDLEKPFYVACGMAFVLFLGGVYAVLVGIQNKKK